MDQTPWEANLLVYLYPDLVLKFAHIDPPLNWEPDLFDRYRYDEWESNGKIDLAHRAQARIEHILAAPQSKKLDQRQAEELAKIIKIREQNQ